MCFQVSTGSALFRRETTFNANDCARCLLRALNRVVRSVHLIQEQSTVMQSKVESRKLQKRFETGRFLVLKAEIDWFLQSVKKKKKKLDRTGAE